MNQDRYCTCGDSPARVGEHYHSGPGSAESRRGSHGIAFRAIVASGLLTLAGCTWVRLDPGAESVRIVTAAEVMNCELVAQVDSTSMDRIAGVRRGGRKLQQELDTLARNEAFRLGADTVSRSDEAPETGRQRYTAWRCGDGP